MARHLITTITNERSDYTRQSTRREIVVPRHMVGVTEGHMSGGVGERTRAGVRTQYVMTELPRRHYAIIDRAGHIAARYETVQGEREVPLGHGQLALLIAGHNEELVIEQTLRSAIKAGMQPEDIYVVDDNSDDATSAIAGSVIGAANVLRVGRSGKGGALTKGAKHFNLTARYDWIHIADADGGFAAHYFDIFRANLRSEYAAATGYIRSLPGSTVGQYRVFEYTVGMEIHRRFQAMTHTISVIPGPTSCFRADVFAKVDFANMSLTEDFDVTLQIHRQKLGKIQFIPEAVAYTQDPRNLRDFTKQITRWNRGIMQGIRRHHIGLHPSRIDAYLSWQVLQNFMLLFSYCFMLPFLAVMNHSLDVVANAFLIDVISLLAITFMVATKTKRMDILSAFPQIYAYRFVTLAVFVRAFVEVMILRKYKVTEGVWGTAGRRFKNPVAI